MNLREIDLEKLNSMTKYPSIPTYHTMDRGVLKEPPLNLPNDPVHVTEKIDGTNARVVFVPGDDGFLIGSREEFLWYSDDLLYNKNQGIVEALRHITPELVFEKCVVCFLEVFGGKTSNQAKQYTGERKVSSRLFDIVTIPVADVEDMLEWPIERISGWRENGGQFFLNMHEVNEGWSNLSRVLGLKNVAGHAIETVPSYGMFETDDFPRTIQETYEWLRQFNETRCALDQGAKGKAEGVVVRTPDRKFIVKIRFEDYERTLRKMKK